jgi:anti-anti-sigma factor
MKGASRAVQRIELDGEYDLARQEEVMLVFDALTAEGPAVIDMTNVTYIDSSFLRALAALHFRLKKFGVTLTGVRPSVRRILKVVAFQRLFSIPG